MKFSDNGVIGKSGKWYSCKRTEHIQTMLDNNDGPFVTTHNGYTAIFEAYYTVDKIKPTQKQFETLMNWCTAVEEKFEDVIDCWDLPWQDWFG